MVIIAGVLHANRIENSFLESLLISLAGNLFDDRSEQKISGVVV